MRSRPRRRRPRIPGRDLSIGIVGSMVGLHDHLHGGGAGRGRRAELHRVRQSPEPLALILRELGQGKAATVIAAAAVIALPTVLLAFLYGQSRIFFVMSRDGLLPRGLSTVSARTGTPIAHHAVHRGPRRRARRRGAAGRDRRAGQCRHAGGLHRGGGVPAGAAQARPGAPARVPHAAGVGGGTDGDPRLPVPVLEPAADARSCGSWCGTRSAWWRISPTGGATACWGASRTSESRRWQPLDAHAAEADAIAGSIQHPAEHRLEVARFLHAAPETDGRRRRPTTFSTWIVRLA